MNPQSPVVVIKGSSQDTDNILGIIERALSSAGFEVSFTAKLDQLALNEEPSNIFVSTTTTSFLLKQQSSSSISNNDYTDSNNNASPSSSSPTDNPNKNDPAYVTALERQVQEKESELDDLENHLTTALSSIKTFHVQQKELFDEFVALRDKYYVQKERLNTAIWEYLPAAEGPLHAIPKVVMDATENQNGVGNYNFGVSLGEGQFAKVRACTKRNDTSSNTNKSTVDNADSNERQSMDLSSSTNLSKPSTQMQQKNKPRSLRRTNSMVGVSEVERKRARYDLAVKIIQKDKIQEARDVYRLHSEISNLKRLVHPNVLQLIDVVHTPNKLYLITDRGGDDLFEYITKRRGRNGKNGNNTEGSGSINRETVQSIMTQLVSGVSALHQFGICHRDLKPENVLLDIHEHLMIVDFGLCEDLRNDGQKNSNNTKLLSDFCGR